jgi:hypothetical protein
MPANSQYDLIFDGFFAFDGAVDDDDDLGFLALCAAA